MLGNIRQAIMDPDDQDRAREAARRANDGSMTIQEFDAEYAGRLEPRIEAALRAILTNPALQAPQAKLAQERIAALVAKPQARPSRQSHPFDETLSPPVGRNRQH